MIKKLEDLKYPISRSAIDRHRTCSHISFDYIKHYAARAAMKVNINKHQVYLKGKRNRWSIQVYAEDLDIREYENEKGYYEDYRTIRGIMETCSSKTLRTLSWR